MEVGVAGDLALTLVLAEGTGTGLPVSRHEEEEDGTCPAPQSLSCTMAKCEGWQVWPDVCCI